GQEGRDVALVAEVSERPLKNESLLAEVESLLPELIERLADQRGNRCRVDDGRRADAAAQALHHDGCDDVYAVTIDQAFLAARWGLLLVIHHQGADGAVAQDRIDQRHAR